MTVTKFNFWQKWLTFASCFMLLIGLLVAFLGNSFIFEAHNSYTQELFFNGEIIEGDMMKLKNWLFGIIGASIVGFASLLILISENSFKNKEAWAYKAIWIGILSWFLIDSGISIYYKAFYNVVIINIPALVMVGLPLIMTRKEFKK